MFKNNYQSTGNLPTSEMIFESNYKCLPTESDNLCLNDSYFVKAQNHFENQP